jgi:hypothetical protein
MTDLYPFLAVLAVVALVTAGCGGGAKTVSVAQVERSFAQHHQHFETEIMAGPNLHGVDPVWPVPGRRAFEPNLLATLTAWDPDTSSGLQAWVFDSAKDARSAQDAAPALADRDVQPGASDTVARPGFVVRQANLVVAGSSSRWPAVQNALADLR